MMLSEEFSWMRREESRRIWDRDEKMEEFAQSLLTTAPVQREAGLEVTALPMALGCNRTEDPRLITRHNTRQVFGAILEQIIHHREQRRFLVQGAEGIGKSRNLAYLLKLLLSHGKIVLYEGAEPGRVVAFIPATQALPAGTTAPPPGAFDEAPQGTDPPSTAATASPAVHTYRCYRANLVKFSMDRGTCALVSPEDAVYLYDASDHGSEPPGMACVTVLVARPNIKYFRNFIVSDPWIYTINMFTEEEVHAFFALVRPENVPRSAPAPGTASVADIFDTPAGPVLREQLKWALGEEHLRCGYYEIGGAVRFLTNWAALRRRIAVRNGVLRTIQDFNRLIYLREHQQLATDDPERSNMFVTFHNARDPRNYGGYNLCGQEVRVISQGTLMYLGWERYNDLYAHTKKLVSEYAYTYAEYFFGILTRAALAEIPVLMVRDLNAAAAARAAHKKSSVLYQLHLGRAAVVPVANIEGRLLSLSGGEMGLQKLDPGLPATVKRTQAMIDAVTTQEQPGPRPATRQLYYTEEAASPILHAFDRRNRGYRFTTFERDTIQYTPMVALLDALGCSPEQPFHLFLAVPQGRFDTWTRLPTLVRSEAGAAELTPEEVAAFYERVHVYVVRVPEKRPC